MLHKHSSQVRHDYTVGDLFYVENTGIYRKLYYKKHGLYRITEVFTIITVRVHRSAIKNEYTEDTNWTYYWGKYRKWSYPIPNIFYIYSLLKSLDQSKNPPFYLLLFRVRAWDALYYLRGLKIFLSIEKDVELKMTKGNIPKLILGTVYCGDRLIRILGIVTHGYSGWYPVVTVCLYPHLGRILYTPDGNSRIWWTHIPPRRSWIIYNGIYLRGIS